MQRAAVVMFVTTTSGVVIAQPSTVEPSVPVQASSAPAYPRALAKRPLVVPDGMIEVDTSLVIFNDKRVFFDPEAKIATPAFELTLGFSYELATEDEEHADLQRLYMGGLRDISPCEANQVAVGAQVVGTTLFGELPAFAPSAIAAYKRVIRPWFALHGVGLLGYEYSRGLDLETDMESSQHGLAASLGARAQLQASDAIAFELRGALGYRQDLGDYTALGLTSFGSQMLGGTLLISASENADLFLAYDVLLRDADHQRDWITFGLTIRRL